MDRAERLEILLRLLSDRPGITAQRLRAELGISERSLFRDLDYLRNRGYPIEGSVGRGGGLRIHPSWGLGRVSLSVEQSLGVLLALAIAEKLGLPLFQSNFKPARQKIAAAFSQSQRALVRRLQDRIFIGQPASAAVKSSYDSPPQEIMATLEKAFFQEKQIQITYTNEKGAVTERTVEPHGLFINWPAWYLLSYDHLRTAPRTFRLDRISRAKIGESPFKSRALELFEQLVGSKFGANL